ncbi:sensor histidine kinase [Geomesophilobacter sediminis]|nr:ATP-binding protein [Geomesophilobacter sediminis]
MGEKKKIEELETQLAQSKLSDEQARRKVVLLSAMIRIFRETASCETEEDVAQVCLKVAQELTGSAYGFIGELNAEGRFDTTTLSRSGWDACQVPMPGAAQLLKSMPNRGINRAGLRDRKSWIINDPEHHPDRVQKPEGHPPITSFLGVPIRYAGGITGMIALASKESGYTRDDQDDVEALSVAFVESLNRRRAERRINELNLELNRHVLQLESANKELEAFSYTVSHDLRAPIRHITGYVELLEKRDLSGLDEKSLHYLQVISEAAQRMGVLIDDLLSFSRMGRAEMTRSPVDMAALVREVVNELTADLPERDVAVEVAPLPVVTGDRAMLRQVLVNLIGNAVKFTQPRPQSRIQVGAVAETGETAFFVRDNGVGFDMRYQDKLFGLFQRLHSLEEFEGTGVGLANVQRIVHRHGGRVWAEGELEHGATFWFTLPRHEEV